jgi:hypothetical protein
MLKAKALCAANGNAAPEIKPLMSVMETPVPAADTHGNGLRDLIGGMQNIVIESVGSDETIPEAVGQLAIRMMKNNDLIKDLMHELRQLYIRGQKEFRLSLAGRSEADHFPVSGHGRIGQQCPLFLRVPVDQWLAGCDA